MNLWIRSQDKTKLMRPINLEVISVTDSTEYAIISFSEMVGDVTLGFYKSKERALEVLDEIQTKINLINLGNDLGGPMIDLKNPGHVYQMPGE